MQGGNGHDTANGPDHGDHRHDQESQGQGRARTDVLTREQRRRCMAAIKGKNTRPERMLRQRLWRMGYRYRIGHGLPGRPDIVFPSRRVVVFVDGCFWHRCPEHYRPPKTNQPFWEAKIQRNVDRDALINAQLAVAGWQVIRVWEHELRQDAEAVAARIAAVLEREATCRPSSDH
ncbi:very short patch repair endonuclease [Megalodesulfovibrio gigas]|uniref:Putative DNA mismatch endonuclease Vsr n=1 Tax=Megalodesulfovibrio gigas (strain ATCC 19364 / DSM 1382 / NCIMB 9332 / VKM B-1759) TaxID=1121448 RepID=T2GD08_MEGG1|nr:very short patch repair endonuclease [Megalodesulfovibrio gigas]AGW13797.1 putative DNA mismatch endonuclease Vsr [Megalodesulfovibrio gigas DSM 1382 = ATCC 19364]